MRCFDLEAGTDANRKRAEALFRCPIWIRLNLGELTQAEAELAYQTELGLTPEDTRKLFFHVMDHQEMIDGTLAIAHRLKDAGYRVFALTDNVHEIVAHLKSRHKFWPLFEGAIVSAEIGLMKPSPEIFRHLLETFEIGASETVFLDDHPPNIEGARSAGLEARLFTTADQCEADLRALGLKF
ncbi:HAD family phosphatase [Bradyrhizobium sp. LHD-71]|nr:HAD family phosphatase [Bradyrhizobium sp. LHD-71]MDQ8726599.1 HAD family phosphatase [Bradyrhizobium sp. LHD-71]